MTEADLKQALSTYLQSGREVIVWKLGGLSEYEVRRPLTPTGTNLLGLVKHLAGVEAGYFGFVMGRPFPEPLPWLEEDAEPNADMWATTEESRAEVLGLYRRVSGFRQSNRNLPDREADWWRGYRDRVEQAARQVGGSPTEIAD